MAHAQPQRGQEEEVEDEDQEMPQLGERRAPGLRIDVHRVQNVAMPGVEVHEARAQFEPQRHEERHEERPPRPHHRVHGGREIHEAHRPVVIRPVPIRPVVIPPVPIRPVVYRPVPRRLTGRPARMQYEIGALLSNVIADNASERLAMEEQGGPAGLAIAALLDASDHERDSRPPTNTADIILREFENVLSEWEKQFVRQHHSQEVNEDQTSRAHIKMVNAPPEVVWSFIKDFFNPMPYKLHIVGCHRVKGEGGVGSIRRCVIRSGIAAKYSVERCEIMDEDNRVASFRVVGGEHRCRNYQSITSLHARLDHGLRATLVIESYVCDVLRGYSTDEVEVYCDGFVKELLSRLNEVASAKWRDARLSIWSKQR